MASDLAALLARIVQRDCDAMLSFYDRTSSRVFGVIATLVPDPAARERVMELTYLEVWETAPGPDPEGCSPSSWLITLAHRIAVDYIRTEGDSAAPMSEHAAGAPSLGSLNDQQRTCIGMAYYCGMTLAQVSQRLGISEEATSAMLADALGTLASDGDGLRSVS